MVMMQQAVRPTLSGRLQIKCVHDRQKRQVVTERQVFELGLAVGIVYDPKQHRIHRCGCCENLFVDPSDEPRYCPTCTPAPVHRLAGPLAAPIGEVDG